MKNAAIFAGIITAIIALTGTFGGEFDFVMHLVTTFAIYYAAWLVGAKLVRWSGKRD